MSKTVPIDFVKIVGIGESLLCDRSWAAGGLRWQIDSNSQNGDSITAFNFYFDGFPLD